MKLVVLIIVLALGYAWWRHQRTGSPPPPAPHAPKPPSPQTMVACAHCGVHLPRSDALTDGTRHYCCAQHQQQDAR